MAEQFCAIDFETANPARGSVCSFGLVRLDADGNLLAVDGGLVHPPAGLDHFAPMNMRIHHISPKKVAGAPGWEAILPRLVDFVGDDLLVAHNAAFERSVIRAASLAVGLADPELPIACTVRMSRLIMPQLSDHKLPTVARHLGVPVLQHHDAIADAAMCGLIATKLLAHARGGAALDQLAAACGEPSRRARLL